ncbi:sensor histidine kinase [Emticicia sp. BO119]|uniref:ATP-binding protein n=1 Tax=Emticicia sp. BO119 TaxID=2757768 RepID=UPI0015F053B6|nr:sensor histidine kinase [Emticicia sp. BO119]MBA4851867.1 sensor histidine kinase [Emticicia sp. BO119]
MLRLFIILLIAPIGFVSCSKGDTSEKIFQKKSDEKLDAYCSYLNADSSLHDSTYLPLFYKRFNRLVSENKIDSASQILFWAGRNIANNFKYDTAFLQVSINFVNKYSSKLQDRYFSGIYHNIGITYCDNGEYDNCSYYLNKGVIQPKDFYTFQNVADINYGLLFGHLNNGKLEQSLKSAYKALEMFETQRDTVFISACYSGIACIYRSQDDFPEAMKYENQGLRVVREARDTSGILTVSLNRMDLYDQMQHPDLYPLIDSTMTLFRQWPHKTEDDKLAINSWYVLKLIHDNKLDEAKKTLDEIKPFSLERSTGSSLDYYNYAKFVYDEKVGEKSGNISFYSNALPKLKENKDYARLALYNQILSENANTKGNYKAAMKYLKNAQTAQDSVSNKALRIKVKEFDRKYQTEKKEQQIELQHKELTQKNTFIALLIASIIGLIAAASAYYLWQRQKTLKLEKESSANFTRQLLENTEEERKRIAGDLHDSISHELLNLKSSLSKDTKAVSSKIDTIINDIRGISRNLHPVMFDKIGLVPNIEQLVERIQNQHNFFISTDVNYTGSLSSANELQIYRIIQETLSNIIKYANAHAAKITINEQPTYILIEIKDNGKGFHVKETLNSGKAFGLHNIIERSRVIGGEAHINSSADGTVITIHIPKKS